MLSECSPKKFLDVIEDAKVDCSRASPRWNDERTAALIEFTDFHDNIVAVMKVTVDGVTYSIR